jgi:hypothetical protein
VSQQRPIINNRLSIRLTSQWTAPLHILEWNVFRGDTSRRSINAKYVDSVHHSINTTPSPLYRKAKKSVHIFSTRKNVVPSSDYPNVYQTRPGFEINFASIAIKQCEITGSQGVRYKDTAHRI